MLEWLLQRDFHNGQAAEPSLQPPVTESKVVFITFYLYEDAVFSIELH